MKVRVKFSKYGAVKFIGHLDVMHYFQKAIRRAGIDIAYSEGFSPHQIMSFASPLSVGHTSEGEYFDIEVHTFEGEAEMQRKLKAQMVEGFDILKVRLLAPGEGNAMASVAAAGYLVSLGSDLKKRLDAQAASQVGSDWKDKLLAFYQRENIPVVKKTKKGQREINLREGIYQLEIRGDDIYMLLDAGSGSNIKPAFVMETFFKESYKNLSEFPESQLHVCRLETYKKSESGELIPLIPE